MAQSAPSELCCPHLSTPRAGTAPKVLWRIWPQARVSAPAPRVAGCPSPGRGGEEISCPGQTGIDNHISSPKVLYTSRITSSRGTMHAPTPQTAVVSAQIGEREHPDNKFIPSRRAHYTKDHPEPGSAAPAQRHRVLKHYPRARRNAIAPYRPGGVLCFVFLDGNSFGIKPSDHTRLQENDEVYWIS